MATFSDMIEETKRYLAGFTMRQERITYLRDAISLTDTVIPVGSASNLAKGIIEVDNELIWIDNFDKANSNLNAAPGFGRGYQGSTASSHAQHAQVTLSPSYPRIDIRRAINDTIQSLFPKLFAVNTYDFTFNAAQIAYAMPADCKTVVFASWQTPGATREWLPLKKWRSDNMANIAAFDSTTTLNIYDAVMPGRTVQVTYASEPQTLQNNTDIFSDVTGLPDTARDVVVLGAAYRLLSSIDAGRLNLTSAEADYADSKIPSTAGVSASRYVFATYQQRLQEEALKLTDKFPIRLHYTR